MAHLSLQLFGRFRASRADGSACAITSRKAQALLAYLALNAAREHPRDKLAAMFWGDRADEQARHSLRQCLLGLHKALDDEAGSIIVSQDQALGIDIESVDVDVLAFQRLTAEGTGAALKEAMALYEGELLDGLVARSEGFDEWLAVERDRLHDLAADTLSGVAALYAESGDDEAAMEAARRLLAMDSLREDAHRLMMRLLDSSGRRSAALRQYQICEETVRRELDAEPEPETVSLMEDIRNRPAPPGEPPAAAAPAVSGTPKFRRTWRWATAAVAACLAIIAAVSALIPDPPIPPPPPTPPPIPAEPSIVILPFQNISRDPAYESFVDGITEDITTALSMISKMFVISRNSALTYKGKAVKIQDVAAALGVRYVLEGSFQKVGDRVRIYAQLIDAVSDHHLWAERYDRETTDVFALQDEITLKIITELQVEMTEGEQARISQAHGTDNLEAWIKAGQALKLFRRLNREDNIRARRLYRVATTIDPNYPGAWTGLAWTHYLDARFGWTASPMDSAQRSAALAQKALALNPSRALTYSLLGSLMLIKGDHDKALALGDKALALGPSVADIAAIQAYTLTFTGDLERSVALITRAMRLSPYYSNWYRWNLGRAYRLMGRYKEAVSVLTKGLADNQSPVRLVELAAAYSGMGSADKAKATAARIMSASPGFSITSWMRAQPYKDPAAKKREIELLRRAGLPE